MASPLEDPGVQQQFPGALGDAIELARRRLAPPPLPALSSPGAASAPTQSAPTPQLAPPSTALPPPIATPAPTEAQQRLQTLQGSASGIDQIPHAALRIPLQVLSAVGSGLFPGIATGIPGTDLHHDYLVRRAERQVGDEAKQQSNAAGLQHLGAQTGLATAQTNEANAKTEELKNPAAKPVTKDLELWMQQNPGRPIADYWKEKTSAEAKAPATVEHVTDAEGNIWAIHPGAEATPVTAGGKQLKAHVTPDHPATPAQQAFDDEIKNGASAKEALKTISGITHPKSDVEPGTFTLAEDAEGKPIMFNSKTGATRPAEGIQRTGTHQKQADAAQKETGPVQSAVDYASDYVNRGVFTGPGDEALQEKFFELAKPSTGFRMTQPQIDMLQHSRGWMEGAGARIHHATTGTWFSDEQRKQIVDTMKQLAAQKLKGHGGQSIPATGASIDDLVKKYGGR